MKIRQTNKTIYEADKELFEHIVKKAGAWEILKKHREKCKKIIDDYENNLKEKENKEDE